MKRILIIMSIMALAGCNTLQVMRSAAVQVKYNGSANGPDFRSMLVEELKENEIPLASGEANPIRLSFSVSETLQAGENIGPNLQVCSLSVEWSLSPLAKPGKILYNGWLNIEESGFSPETIQKAARARVAAEVMENTLSHIREWMQAAREDAEARAAEEVAAAEQAAAEEAARKAAEEEAAAAEEEAAAAEEAARKAAEEAVKETEELVEEEEVIEEPIEEEEEEEIIEEEEEEEEEDTSGDEEDEEEAEN